MFCSLTVRPACLIVAAVLTAGVTARAGSSVAVSNQYKNLISLFSDWRAFQGPKLVDGVPDYGAKAMDAQRRELSVYQQRLNAIDPTGWPANQQVDWHIVRAEMNGLDFDQRVLRPWANNPGFYVTVFPSQSDQPAREGPHAEGAVEIWTYTFPLTADQAAKMDTQIRIIPRLLDQARVNLSGNGKDLWIYGAKSISRQSAVLERLAAQVGDTAVTLKADVQRAKQATDGFASWLDAQASTKDVPSGVGRENYDWYL